MLSEAEIDKVAEYVKDRYRRKEQIVREFGLGFAKRVFSSQETLLESLKRITKT